MRHKTIIVGAAVALCVGLSAGCMRRSDEFRDLSIFHASILTAVFDAMRPVALEQLRLRLQTEAGGSQVLCRKITELRRECDVLALADARLVGELLSGFASWRIDFATDEMVLAVGARAPETERAEFDWPAVLRHPAARLGRVDERLGPTGYRTRLVWKLQELLGHPGLDEALLQKTDKVLEHVTQLAPLLKQGEIDYAFVYRSLCYTWDIRYIRLDPRVNLGDDAIDYSAAVIQVPSLAGGDRLIFRGEPIRYTLTIPDGLNAPSPAIDFVRLMLTQSEEALTRFGYVPLPTPRYYGPREAFQPFADLAEYAGGTP